MTDYNNQQNWTPTDPPQPPARPDGSPDPLSASSEPQGDRYQTSGSPPAQPASYTGSAPLPYSETGSGYPTASPATAPAGHHAGITDSPTSQYQGYGGEDQGNPNPGSYQPLDPKYSPNPSGSYRGIGSSYTWNQNSSAGTPVTYNNGSGYYAPPVYPTHNPKGEKKEKPKKQRRGLRFMAVILCCLLSAGASLGGFVGLVKNGTIAVTEPESGEGNAAFTINKVIREESGSTTPMGEGVRERTPQEVAEEVIPSVVCLQIYQDTPNYYDFFGFGMGPQGGNNGETASELASQGSGIIYTEDGYVITNAHVVADATKIQVITSDGVGHEAELVGADGITDLAVVKIDNPDGIKFPAASFGSSEDMQVADQVMAIGSPGGIELSSTVTMGYVSALDRAVTDPKTGYTMNCIQTDAAISPGNSGGALVNLYGQVIGINSSKVATASYEGLGFAIPSDTAQPIVSDLMRYGYVKDRAMLGISIGPIDAITAQFNNIKPGMCVYQLNTQEAQDSGLHIEDIITAFDGEALTTTGEISVFLMSKKPGDTVKLTVYRNDTKETLELDLVLSQSTSPN